jgi:hypothetical protein
VSAQFDLDLDASESAMASESADASKSAIAKAVEKKPDITEPEGEVTGKLEKYLDEKKIGQLGLNNVLQYAIRKAVSRGVPANTIVLMILFPVVAAIIAASRHLFGLRGFGIFTPAVLSVAFVATGLVSGILVFLVILMVASIGRMILKKMKLHYLPRMALLLWFVSLGVFGLMFLSSYVELEAVVKLNIFPILILVLLAENFIEVQMGKSKKEAISLTTETILLAVISSFILSLDIVQKTALLNPEIVVVTVLVFDVFVGRYVGLRYGEKLKFKKLIG